MSIPPLTEVSPPTMPATAPPSATASQSSAPGNSANAPGHQKAKGGGSAIQTSTAGVKPSNATVQAKDTHATASSNRTKLYGNGKTAGQIAIKNGAAPSTILHGPGNSQPHKAAPCSGGHEIDVHALKGRGHQRSCGKTPSPPVSHPVPPTSSNPKPDSDPKATSLPTNKPTKPTISPAKPPVRSKSGVLASSGVLSATRAVGQGTLPFTGFPLWMVVIVAATMIVVGLALRRRSSS